MIKKPRLAFLNQQPYWLYVSVPDQTLTCFTSNKDELIKTYSISTALNGVGEEYGSFKTPRGWHQIRAKIGTGLPANAVLTRRRFTGEIFSEEMKTQYPERDWILTRILWLSGLEVGKNRLGPTDTMRRYVYIHGTPDSTVLGVPGSKGCIRMRNEDLIELFELLPYHTPILIE